MSKKIVIANWKMNPSSLKEAEKLFLNTAKSVSGIKKTEVVICPPFLYLANHKKNLRKVSLGAQDVFWESAGAYTGEVSGDMLYDTGVRYVIVGHSERRAAPVRQNLGVGGGETNEVVNKKIKATIASGLRPILCIGEKIRDENHGYLNFIKTQLKECLNGVSKNSLSKIIITYEPVWAIGKGAYPATAEEFREMNIFIKKILSDKFGVKEASNIKIIYGGSVDEKNAGEFVKEGKADGFLLGRASLDPEKFSKIVKICSR